MDNLTHSLAGLITGEAAVVLRARFGSPASAHYRAASLTTAVLANNAPDADFAYVRITGGKLGYLLHHRGHTHTLGGVLLLGVLVLALVAIASRLKTPRLTRPDLMHLGLLGVLGGVLHVSMDFCNNYGVHPFWPLYDGWFYGDAIFIIDPWLLIILIGMAIGVSASRALRGALLLGLCALLGLAWRSRLAGFGLASLLSAFALVWVAALWRAPFRTRWFAGSGALLVLGVCLLGTRQVARASVRAALERSSPPEFRLAELVSTPAPGDPLCWSILAVQVSDQRYVVRQALVAGWPALSSVAHCRAMNDGQTAPLVPSSLAGDAGAPDGLAWGPEFSAPLAELRAARDESCVARAFLRFARVPYWVQRGDRAGLIGDLRFDRSSALEFAELELDPSAPCPRHEPPWLPPFSEL